MQPRFCGRESSTLSLSKVGVLQGLRDCPQKPSVYSQTCILSFMSLLQQTPRTFGETLSVLRVQPALGRARAPSQSAEKWATWWGRGEGHLTAGWGRSDPWEWPTGRTPSRQRAWEWDRVYRGLCRQLLGLRLLEPGQVPLDSSTEAAGAPPGPTAHVTGQRHTGRDRGDDIPKPAMQG